MDNRNARAWRRIQEEEAELAGVAFILAHPACGDSVSIQRGTWSLVCWCARCEDIRTFELVHEES